jgi:hypothetical protein
VQTEVGAAVKLLSDELSVRAEDGAEALHLVMLDQRMRVPASS